MARRAHRVSSVHLVSIAIPLLLASHPNLAAQQVSAPTPPTPLVNAPAADLPIAQVISTSNPPTATAHITSVSQKQDGDLFTLDGDVIITYRDYTIHADHVEYNRDTQDSTADGHLTLDGGEDQERISATHGDFNFDRQTGRFYDVSGSVGVRSSGTRLYYTSGNPFLFAGKIVVKTGPTDYDIYDGWVTSCQLSNPDWRFSASHFSVDSKKAHAAGSVFHLLNVPLLYLPYVTHPVDISSRESGFLTPILGQSSSKGFIIGERYYMALNRSSELTIGAEYFSRRGWQQSADLRYRGLMNTFTNNFLDFHYTGLLDRGYIQPNGAYANQGGEDATFSARYDFDASTRAVIDAEYLSSYVYREAFSGNFNQAISSDVLSTVFYTHQWDGISAAARVDRYQGLKRVVILPTPTNPGTPGEQVHIIHAPSLDIEAIDHPIGHSKFLWSFAASAAGLKRVQPNFVTGGIVERFDLHPQLSYPISAAGWRFLPSIAVRDTVYSRSRVAPYTTLDPIQSSNSLNRGDVELHLEARAPVVERTFTTPRLGRFLGTELRHTIEPQFTYINVHGVNNFLSVLRFDDTDVASNTDEIQYGVTQHLYARGGPASQSSCRQENASAASAAPSALAAAGESGLEERDIPTDANTGASAEAAGTPDAPIRAGHTTAPPCVAPQKEWLSWRLTQKYFFDPTFGNAISLGRRNIFTSTLDLSGVAFLTEPREISPLVSRLRMRTTNNLDIEWDFDLDTGAKKFNSNNVFLDLHEGNVFGGMSYARLNAPGRFNISGFNSSISNFTQLRLLAGYGQPTKAGLSMAANAGLDLDLGSLQYGAIQTSYNWDCCGLSVEYRKFELGSVRNEGVYRFNFTLANIGAAGNLRRAERLF